MSQLRLPGDGVAPARPIGAPALALWRSENELVTDVANSSPQEARRRAAHDTWQLRDRELSLDCQIFIAAARLAPIVLLG